MKELQDLNNQSEYYINKVITRYSLPHLEMMLPHFKGIASTDIRRGERLVEGVVEGLVENQRKMLELIIKNPYISKKEMAKRIGISTTAIDKNIRTLKKKGLLRRIGPAKGGYWEVIK